MEGFATGSKSTYGDVDLCPFHAWMIKSKKAEKKTTIGGRRGRKQHGYVADIRLDKLDLDGALVKIASDPDEEDRETVSEVVHLGIANDPVKLSDAESKTLCIEKQFAMDGRGRTVGFFDKKAILRGIIDRMFMMDNGIVRVDDLKGGWKEEENEKERYIYILGARSLYPRVDRFEFAYLWARSGNYPIWQFSYSKDGHVLEELTPDGRLVSHKFAKNPLLVYVESWNANIKAMEPIPKPGPHCESWYGEPCQFLGNECPLGSAMPEVIDNAVIIPASVNGENEKKSISERLKEIVNAEDITALAIYPEEISIAYSGMVQFKAFTKALEKACEEWSRKYGPIQLGDSKYGWFTQAENEVDKEFVLGEMLRSDMTTEEIAKVASISKTSIDTKISKRRYGALRKSLLAIGVSEVGSKPKFGELKAVEE